MHFDPGESWLALLGGGLIGLSAGILWLGLGRVAGISGICGSVLARDHGPEAWRAWFLLGLVGAGATGVFVSPSAFAAPVAPDRWWLAVAGLLVGAGTRMGSGCTSGHGVCGISRLSKRSAAATVVFIGAGAAAVIALRVLGVGA